VRHRCVLVSFSCLPLPVIPSDYSTQLTFLLRYPTPPSHEEHEIHHATLLIRQALNLQMAPRPATGASLMMENRNSLGISIEVPDPPPLPPKRQSGSARGERAALDTRPWIPGTSRPPQNRHVSHQSLGLPEMIAKGLMDRGESLGINKTLLSAVSELKACIFIHALPNSCAQVGLEEESA
jgi:TBC1 domain family member 5